MSKSLNELLDQLAALQYLHEQLYKLAEQKRSAIITGKLEPFEEVTKAERELVQHIEDIEKLRQQTVLIVAGELKISKLKLIDIIEACPNHEWKDKLKNQRDSLKNAVEKIRLYNRQNSELLKASIEHVHAFMKMVGQASSVNPTYSTQGMQAMQGRCILDQKI